MGRHIQTVLSRFLVLLFKTAVICFAAIGVLRTSSEDIAISPCTLSTKAAGNLTINSTINNIISTTDDLQYLNNADTFFIDEENPYSEPEYDNIKDFENYKNDTPATTFLSPNIIHYIRWNKTEYSFVDYICLRSAYLNHKPKFFFIHTDVNFTGKWWNEIQSDADLSQRIKVKYLAPPSHIFGQELSDGWRHHHGSDIGRIRILMKYGGIWLDNDMYVVQNMDYYRRFELSIGWDDNQFLGTQVIVCNRNARFLPKWLETYRKYDRHRWYWNASEKPTSEILFVTPELVHRVKGKFGVEMLERNLYRTYWKEWRDRITIHLVFNHRSYLDKENFQKYGTFNETNILGYNATFGTMAREVLKPLS